MHWSPPFCCFTTKENLTAGAPFWLTTGELWCAGDLHVGGTACTAGAQRYPPAVFPNSADASCFMRLRYLPLPLANRPKCSPAVPVRQPYVLLWHFSSLAVFLQIQTHQIIQISNNTFENYYLKVQHILNYFFKLQHILKLLFKTTTHFKILSFSLFLQIQTHFK